MSDTDTFIDEVTEEVRNDKLYALLRKYGWIGAVLVAVIVGGAAYKEWSDSKARSAAEARGDAMLAAMDGTTASARVEALKAIETDGDSAAVLALLTASETDDPAVADAALKGLADDPEKPTLYRDLATLKRVSLPGGTLSAASRIELLEPLVASGGVFRVLAEEQLALAELELGNSDSAITRLKGLLEDADASEGLRTRAQQLIVALGGTVDEAGAASE
ncbi:MAG: hypothetical protein ACRBCL_11915 [Maritimibacter sp.]